MSEKFQWEREFSKEIENARSSREAGNEGCARVCARRAAGIAAGVYLSQIMPDYKIKGALENLSNLQSHPDVPEDVKELVNIFLIHVDYDHNLPIEADLIEEAINLKILLFTLVEQKYE
jgi:hypothetical protein